MTQLIGSDRPISGSALDVLRALLDTLLPASDDGRMPSAADVDFLDHLERFDADHVAQLASVLRAFDDEFARLDLAARVGDVARFATSAQSQSTACTCPTTACRAACIHTQRNLWKPPVILPVRSVESSARHAEPTKHSQSDRLADASFATLLVMLIAAVFVLPVVMAVTTHGVLLFNVLLLSVFLSGIFSTRSVGLISVSAILFGIHLTLRLIRFGENPYSFFVLENVIGIANTLVFIFINLRLLFRDQSVNAYRIVGAVNVYLVGAHGRADVGGHSRHEPAHRLAATSF